MECGKFFFLFSFQLVLRFDHFYTADIIACDLILSFFWAKRKSMLKNKMNVIEKQKIKNGRNRTTSFIVDPNQMKES